MIALWKDAVREPSALRKQNFIAVFVILFVFVFHGVVSLGYLAETYDENAHYQYGSQLLTGNAERVFESTMPISMWNALPGAFASFLPVGGLKSFFGSIFAARLMTIFFSAGIAFGIFHFARVFYGFLPAMAALFLFVLDPNILAHSQLVTTDIYATGFLLLTIFALWRYALFRNWKNAFFLGISLGLAQITKYTAVSYPFLALFTLGVYDCFLLWRKGKKNWGKEMVGFLKEYLRLAILIFVLSVLILNIAYFFQNTFVPFGKYTFRYAFLSTLQKDVPVLRSMPVPIPYAHLQGFDWILEYERTGQGHGNHYLLGNTRTGEGFAGYFIIASLLKEPIFTQVIIFLAFIRYFSTEERRKLFWQQEIFLFIPIVFYFVYFNFIYHSQIGIRYYLIIFPLLFVFAGSLFVKWHSFSRLHWVALSIGFVYLAASIWSYFPYYIPYFNETIGDRKNAYLYLADSNLDWGQGRYALEVYLQDYPSAQYEPDKMVSGLIVISPNALVGVTESPAKYAWLRENFEPVDIIAYEYLVYDISPFSFEEQCERTKFCK